MWQISGEGERCQTGETLRNVKQGILCEKCHIGETVWQIPGECERCQTGKTLRDVRQGIQCERCHIAETMWQVSREAAGKIPDGWDTLRWDSLSYVWYGIMRARCRRRHFETCQKRLTDETVWKMLDEGLGGGGVFKSSDFVLSVVHLCLGTIMRTICFVLHATVTAAEQNFSLWFTSWKPLHVFDLYASSDTIKTLIIAKNLQQYWDDIYKSPFQFCHGGKEKNMKRSAVDLWHFSDPSKWLQLSASFPFLFGKSRALIKLSVSEL